LYQDAFSGELWLDTQAADFSDKPANTTISWYEPWVGFWPKAARLLNTFADAYRPAEDERNVMTSNTPVPQPVIRQVPRE
jgi:hypothetical protein